MFHLSVPQWQSQEEIFYDNLQLTINNRNTLNPYSDCESVELVNNIIIQTAEPIIAGSHCYLPDNWIKWQCSREKWVKTACAEQTNTFHHLRRSQH